MRKALAGAVVLLVLAGAGCKPDGIDLSHTPGPVPSRVEVDTPELEALRAETAMPDCPPGPGGGALPALTLDCLGGGTPVDLSSLKGPLVLNLWGAYCGPCRKEMPLLEEFYQRYGDRVPVLGVDFQDQFPASALKQIQTRKVSYPSLADPTGTLQEHQEFAKIPGMPMTYLIDADGRITGVNIGELDSVDQLTELVQDDLGVTL